MESFGREASFGLIRRGNASDMAKMKPHFFRVMLDFMLQDAKIYIPTEFVKKYRTRLGSYATLKVANGDTWEVELTTDAEGLIWLVKGWEDLTKQQTLKQGDILVFRLEQDSSFHVMVFDPTASEKNYICKDVDGLGRLFSDVKVEEGIDMGKEKGRGEGRRNVGTGGMKVEGKLKQVKKEKGGGEGKRKGKLASPLEIPNHPLETKMRGTPEARRDNASTSSENPNFSITISQYHMTQNLMRMPAAFVFGHMRPEHSIVIVSGEEGAGPWAMSFLFERPREGRRGRGRGTLAAGWPAFRRDNSLKPGDVCRFELISDGQMKVTIQRA